MPEGEKIRENCQHCFKEGVIRGAPIRYQCLIAMALLKVQDDTTVCKPTPVEGSDLCKTDLDNSAIIENSRYQQLKANADLVS